MHQTVRPAVPSRATPYRTMPKPVQSMRPPRPTKCLPSRLRGQVLHTSGGLPPVQNISCIATVNPSTIVLLADRLAKHTEAIIRDVRDGSLSRTSMLHQAFAHAASAPRLRAGATPRTAAAAGGGSLRPGLAWPNLPRSGAGREERSVPISPTSIPSSFSAHRSETWVITPPSCAGRSRSATRAMPCKPSRSGRTCSSSGPPTMTATPWARELLPVHRLETGKRYYVHPDERGGSVSL